MDCISCKKLINESTVKIYPLIFEGSIEEDWRAHFNKITTNKYRFYNFIFLNLFEQFKRYSNIFFIIVVILNFIPNIQAYSKETAIIPVAFVLITTMIKDGYEDVQRWKNDRVVNNRRVQTYDKEKGEFVMSSWSEVKVGDMIKLSANERIPADLLLYYTSDVSGQCFIETIDIDGETNLKQRSIFKQFENDKQNCENIFQNYYFEVEAPNKEIYKFNGKIIDARDNKCVQMVKNTNLVLRDTLLRNTDEIRGIVIYAGNKTKTLMNNKKPRFKRSMLEDQLNIDIIWCIGILLIVCVMNTLGNLFWVNSLIDLNNIVFYSFTLSSVSVPIQQILLFLSCIIVYQVIIPLPLYITLELVKMHQILHIKSDMNLYDEELDKAIEVRAYNITEDMGQIKYMFCDKTGTLTENKMIFKKATIGDKNYEVDNELVLHVTDHDSKSLTINAIVEDFLLTSVICNTTIIGKTSRKEKNLVDIIEIEKDLSSAGNSQINFDILHNIGIIENTEIENIAAIMIDEFQPIPKDLVFTTPEHAESCDSSLIKTSNMLSRIKISDEELFSLIQSESPDEDALVKFACCNGYKLYQRTIDIMTIWNAYEDKWIDYEILKTIPFDSIRKCMSVIVKSKETGLITMFCKGADSVMFDKIKVESNEENIILNKVKFDIYTYACEGLRTLVMAKKNLSEKEYHQYEKAILAVEETLVENEEALRSCFNEIESDLKLIGAAGIEDKLQDQVPEVLECFKDAGITIWILTGDKRETAINIAYSTRLFSKDEIILEITGSDEDEIRSNLRKHRITIEESIYKGEKSHGEVCSHQEFGLVIDGSSLAILFSFDEIKTDKLSAEELSAKKLISEELNDHFLQITYFCNSVVCCRCTPIQKADIVALIKSKFNVRTLAIGDGANDVNMIQTADVGIGIGGKEGMQATMAADFAICKFKFLKRLILVHGHWSYDRLSRMSLYIFYKDFFIAMVYFLYQTFCGFSMSTAVDQVTQIIFHILHTGLPPVIFGIWDKDFDDRILMANPSIYKTGINSKMYRFRDFWRNVTDAIYQAICVNFICFLLYQNTEIGMAEFGIITVSTVIIAMFGHILIESKHWSFFIWFSCIGCLFIGFYLEVFIINSLCVVKFDCKTDNPYKVLQNVMAQGKTYVVILIVVSTSLFPRIFLKALLGHSRNSIGYEAQHRINQHNLSRTASNIFQLRNEIESAYQFNYKDSIYYLGNLETIKKIECKKCDFKETFFKNRIEHKRNTPRSKVAPLNI